MLDFSAYLAAQHLTEDATLQVSEMYRLPDDPVTQRGLVRFAAARQWTSSALRRLADVIATAPSSPVPARLATHHA
jgi:hypothetical protein